jgi:hypothetical protein
MAPGVGLGSRGIFAPSAHRWIECRLPQRLARSGQLPQAELLHVLKLPDFERPTGSESSGAPPRAARSPSS